SAPDAKNAPNPAERTCVKEPWSTEQLEKKLADLAVTLAMQRHEMDEKIAQLPYKEDCRVIRAPGVAKESCLLLDDDNPRHLEVCAPPHCTPRGTERVVWEFRDSLSECRRVVDALCEILRVAINEPHFVCRNTLGMEEVE